MRIESKKDLNDIIQYEKCIYFPSSPKERFIFRYTQNERYLFFKYLKLLRHEEYCLCKKGFFYKLLSINYSRKKNCLGNKIGLKIMPLYTGKGINIHHKNIIINGFIGNDCIFHGNNCIGNRLNNPDDAEILPRIKDRIEFGYGSIVIGDVLIESDVRIGAGAVVIKDIPIQGETVVGIPAKARSKQDKINR